MTRRQVLLGALTCVSSLSVFRQPRGVFRVGDWCLGLISNPGAAISLGALYLQRRPDENSMEHLSTLLFGCHADLMIDFAKGQRLRRQLRDACIRDFCQDDLEILDGWCVTRTEARLLALLSLHSRS